MQMQEVEFHKLDLKYAHLRARDPKQHAKLLASLAEDAQQSPVLVTQDDNNRYVLIDGYRRVKALRSLSHDTVKAFVLPIGELEALIWRQIQERVAPRSALEDGWFLQELVEKHGMTREELIQRLQRSESWISRRLALVTVLPEKVQQLVRQGKIPPYAAAKFLVPLARAKKKDCLTLVENLGNRRNSSRELERIYTAWRYGRQATRKRIVDDPKLFLKIDEKLDCAPKKRKITNSGIPISQELEILTAVCRRTIAKLQDGFEETTLSAEKLQYSWKRLRQAFADLEQLFNERNKDDRQREAFSNTDSQRQRTRDQEDSTPVEDLSEHSKNHSKSENSRGTYPGTVRESNHAP